MSYTFRVVFDGVCGYVPEKPFFKRKEMNQLADGEIWSAQEKIAWLDVLLPDLRRPGETFRPNGNPNNPVYLPRLREPHFPLLRFKLADLREGTTRRVDLVHRDISERDERGLLFLRREQVRFDVHSQNEDSFAFADWIPPNKSKPSEQYVEEDHSSEETYSTPRLGDQDEFESLWWLPDLDQITPERLKVRDDLLRSYRGPFPEGLVSRIECNGGRLRTFAFNIDVGGKPIEWRFASPSDSISDGCWNRAIGNSLALEFFDVRGEVSIELKRLANEVVTKKLVLAPAPGASCPVLEIEISNREPDLLFQEEGFSRAALPDMDFQAFYEKLVPDFEFREYPVPHPSRQSFFGVIEKPCAGTSLTAPVAQVVPGGS